MLTDEQVYTSFTHSFYNCLHSPFSIAFPGVESNIYISQHFAVHWSQFFADYFSSLIQQAYLLSEARRDSSV